MSSYDGWESCAGPNYVFLLFTSWGRTVTKTELAKIFEYVYIQTQVHPEDPGIGPYTGLE